MSRCTRGLDADQVVRTLRGELPELEEHVRDCPACARIALSMQAAKKVWRDAAVEDDMRSRTPSEQRLARGWPKPRPAFAWRSALVGASIAAVLMLRFGPRWPQGPARAPTAVAVATSSSSSLPDAGSPGPSRPEAPVVQRSVLVVRDCPACTRTGISARSPLDAVTDVPRGATLMLGWLVAGKNDPEHPEQISSMNVSGPARVVTSASDPQTVHLERGRAEVRSSGEGDVQSPHAKMHASPSLASTWRVDVTPGRTSIVVDSGLLVVDAVERTAPSVRLQAGQTMEVRSGGEIVMSPSAGAPSANVAMGASRGAPKEAPPPPEAPPAPSATTSTAAPTDDDRWQSVQDALHAGDRAMAESKARDLMLAGQTQRYRDKASFVVAELELARGDGASAQGRLSTLMAMSRDPSLTADAAFLLARSRTSPADRAEVWTRFLATSPASPYREQAMLERGRALADAGDLAGARRMVEALEHIDPLPDIVARGLPALKARTR